MGAKFIAQTENYVPSYPFTSFFCALIKYAKNLKPSYLNNHEEL